MEEEEDEAVAGCVLSSISILPSAIMEEDLGNKSFNFTSETWDLLQSAAESGDSETLVADVMNSQKWIVSKLNAPGVVVFTETEPADWSEMAALLMQECNALASQHLELMRR
jgi:hypothetical protein